MPEYTIAGAAVALGLSVDTIRRRVKRGDFPTHTAPNGKLMVSVPDELLGSETQTASSATQVPHDTSDLERELQHVREILERTERERDLLAEQVRADTIERSELRQLIHNAQQLARALPSGIDTVPTVEVPLGYSQVLDDEGQPGMLKRAWRSVFGWRPAKTPPQTHEKGPAGDGVVSDAP